MELYSTVLENLGYDPLPYFEEPGESPYSTPELAKEYPLVLTTGFRSPFYFLAQYRNIPWLRSFMEYPTMQINPETAKKLGIEDGDFVWIESPRGRIIQPRPTGFIRKRRPRVSAACLSPIQTF
jgi:anaerobic selenocysteine-containing dehydrogenase